MFQARKPIFVRACAGNGYFAGQEGGIVNINGQGVSRLVCVLDQETMQLVRATISQENGAYCLAKLDPNRDYLIIAIDHLGQYDPVAYSHIRPFKETDE